MEGAGTQQSSVHVFWMEPLTGKRETHLKKTSLQFLTDVIMMATCVRSTITVITFDHLEMT